MNNQKIIVVHNGTILSCGNGLLKVSQDETENSIAFSSIESLVISNTSISLSAYLLNELIANSIKVIFCDDKHKPLSLLLPLHGNAKAPLATFIQNKWNKRRKEKLWKKIVEYKIINSIEILKKNGIAVNPNLVQYSKEVKSADKTNREALAAKCYFKNLFGEDFVRESDCEINSFLNYGYSIVVSHISNILVGMGYNTETGIHHSNEFNMLNLTYDFIEPCRSFVDQLVYEVKQDMELTKEIKQKLVLVLEMKCMYRNKELMLKDAIELYIRDCIDYLSEESDEVGNIEIV